MISGDDIDFESAAGLKNCLLDNEVARPASGDKVEREFWYNSASAQKRIEFKDDTIVVLVPRLDYNESVTGRWAFTHNPGGVSSFTNASIVRVDNLNTHYIADVNDSNTGRAGSSAASVSTAAIRDSNGRLLAVAPSGAVDAELVTYGFLYSFTSGVRDPKTACLAAFAGAIPVAYTWDAGNQTITSDTLVSVNPVDGQTLAVNDRVAVLFETGLNAPYNGIYIVTQVGSAGVAAFILQRAADADSDAEVTNGMQFWVTTGTTWGSSGWLLTTTDPITLDTDDLTFVQNNGTTGITAGGGMTKTGNTLDVVTASASRIVINADSIDLAATAVTPGSYGGPAHVGDFIVDAYGRITYAASTPIAIGTAAVTYAGTQYGVAYYATTTTLGTTGAGTSTQVLHGNSGGAPTWGAVSLTADVSGTLPIANGGTGSTTLAAAGIVVGSLSTNKIPKAISATALSDSTITDDGTTVTLTGTSLNFASGGANGYISYATNLSFIGPSSGTFILRAGNTSGDVTISDSGGTNTWAFGGAARTLTGNGASTIATSAGAVTLAPASGSSLLVNLATTGDFIVNTDDFVVDTSSGNVGIGTASPGAKLSVVRASSNAVYPANASAIFEFGGSNHVVSLAGTAANDLAYVFSTSDGAYDGVIGYGNGLRAMYFNTAGARAMTINSSGNVGIGTTSPVAKAHLKGSGTSGQVTASFILENLSSGTTGMDITGTAGSSRARWLYGGGPSTGTNTLTEGFCLMLEGASAGNVGVGTTSPGALLDVENNADSVTSLRVGNSSTGTSAGTRLLLVSDGGNVQLKAMSTTNVTYGQADCGVINCDNMSSGLRFSHNDVVGMTFAFSGNVGIGTPSPSSKLDVTTAGLGTTQTATSGLALVNTTAATVGAQQISPALRFSGFGWKTDATAASQAVDFRNYCLPVQGAAAPTGNLLWQAAINGGAYSTLLTLSTAGLVTLGGSGYAVANGILQTDGSGVVSSLASIPAGTTIGSLAISRYQKVNVTGDGLAGDIVVPHSLGTRAPVVTVWRANATYETSEIITVKAIPTVGSETSSLTLKFTPTQTASDYYVVALAA